MTLRGAATACSLIIFGAISLQAHAGGADRAADACIRSFVDTYFPKSAPLQVRTRGPIPGPHAVHVRKYTIDLSARLSRSGKEVVTARCVADSTGQVISLDGPLPAAGERALVTAVL